MSKRHLISICFLVTCMGFSVATFTYAARNSESLFLTTSNSKDSNVGHESTISNIVGTWEAKVFGHQVLTTRPDGTATIQMSLTPFAAVLYGKKVTLDLRWKLEGEVLTQQIVGGSPTRSVEKLIAKFGDTQQYHVLETNPDQLLVADAGTGKEPVRWTAVSMAN